MSRGSVQIGHDRIMLLFAFANVVVSLGAMSFTGDAQWVFWGVVLGLLIGKSAGIWGLSWLAARTGAVRLPNGLQSSHVGVVGMVGGIGFTMAHCSSRNSRLLPAPLLETAKLAILCGSGLAGGVSLLVGYRILTRHDAVHAARNEAEAETSRET